MALFLLSEAEAYFCVFEMLEISRNAFNTINQEKKTNKLKYLWYFHMNFEDFDRFFK